MWTSAILMAILSLVHCHSESQGYSYQKPSFGSPAEFVGEAAIGGTHTSTDTSDEQPKHVYLHFVPSLQTGVRPEESQLDAQNSLPIKELKISLHQSSSSTLKKKPRVVISPLNAEQVYTREHQGSRSSKKGTSWVNFNLGVPSTRKKVQKRPTQEERVQKIPIYRGPVNGQNIPGSLQGKSSFKFSAPVGKITYANDVNGGGYVVGNTMQELTEQMGYILVMPSFGRPVHKETYDNANGFEQNVPRKTVQSIASVNAEANKGETSAHIYKTPKTAAVVHHQPTTQGYTESNPNKNRPTPSGCCSGNDGSGSGSARKGLISQGWRPIYKPGQINPDQHGAIESIPSSLTQESGQDGYTSQGYQYRKPFDETDNRSLSGESIQQGFSAVKSSPSPQGYDAAKFYDTYHYRTLPEEVIRGQTYEKQVIQEGTSEGNLGENQQGYKEDINEGNGYRTLPDEIIQGNGAGNGYRTLPDDITQEGYHYESSANQGSTSGQDLQQGYDNGGYVYGKNQQEPAQFDHGSWVGQGRNHISSSGEDSRQKFGIKNFGPPAQEDYGSSQNQEGVEISSSGRDLQQQNGGYIYDQNQRKPDQGQQSYDSSRQEGAQISSSGQDLLQTFGNGGYTYGNDRQAEEQFNSAISGSQGPAQASFLGQDLQQKFENGGYIYDNDQHRPAPEHSGLSTSQGPAQVSSPGQDLQQKIENDGYIYGNDQHRPAQEYSGLSTSQGVAQVSSPGQDLQQKFENGGYIYGNDQHRPAQEYSGLSTSQGVAQVSSSGQDLQQKIENDGYIYGNDQHRPAQKYSRLSTSQGAAQVSSSGQDLQQKFENSGYIYGNDQHRPAQKYSRLSTSQGAAQVSSSGQDLQQKFENSGYIYGNDQHRPAQEDSGLSTSQGPAQLSSPGQDLQQTFENGGYVYGNDQYRPAQEHSHLSTSQGPAQVRSPGQDLQQKFENGGYIYDNDQPSNQDRTQISSSGQDLQQNFGSTGYVYGEIQRKSSQGQPKSSSSPLSGQGRTQVSSFGQDLQQKFENGGYIYGTNQPESVQQSANYDSSSPGRSQVGFSEQNPQQEFGSDGNYDENLYKSSPDELTQKQLNYEPQGALEEIPQVNFAEGLQEFGDGQISYENTYKTLPNQLTYEEGSIPQGVNQEALLDVSLPQTDIVQGFSSDGTQYPESLSQGELQKAHIDNEIIQNAQFTIPSYPGTTQGFEEQFLGYPSL